MSNNSQAHPKPINSYSSVAKLAAQAMHFTGRCVSYFATTCLSFKKQQQEMVGTLDSFVPEVMPNPTYEIADRVFVTVVNGRRLSFFHYIKAGKVTITCRELPHFNPLEFTQALAREEGLSLNIDCAIEWVRRHGLPGTSKKVPKPRQTPKPALTPVSRSVPAPQLTKSEPVRRPVREQSKHAEQPSEAGGKPPFTGRIVRFGNIKRTSSRDGKSYETFSLKLESLTGAFTKEFNGEHLAELVAEMGLEVNDTIKIQLTGKHEFQVEVNGVVEFRTRNHYHIDKIK